MTDDPIKNYFEVAVSAPINRSLTYLPLDDCDQQLTPGMRVLVPLGRRRITGYILSQVDSAPTGQQIKKIFEVLDSEPLFPAEQVGFYKWIARYYHFPIGEVIKAALPAGLTKKSGRRVLITEEGKIPLHGLSDTEVVNKTWFASFLEKGGINPAATARLWPTKDRRLLESWEEKSWITISSELVGGSTKAKKEICYALADQSFAIDDLKISEQKTINALQQISTETNRRLVPRREITGLYRGAGKGLKSLGQKNIVLVEDQQVYRDPFGECFLESDIPETLTDEQVKVLDSILPAIQQKTFTSYLLHGITGSGKTEVYLQAAAFALQQGRSVLVLVPEIALATQLEAHFLSRFGNRVALLHSGLSAGQRYDQWCRIAEGKADVVVGARSAVFAPLAEPGLIIVDEEHDSSYKQDDGFRYHARDLAVLRASRSKGVVILGSATPSVTSYYHVSTGKYNLLELVKRIEDRPLPQVEVVNMQEVKAAAGKFPVFSPVLIRNLRENLQRREQSLVFLNRRGYANFMICSDCGQTVQCQHCQISLTLHRTEDKLLCHYCGFTVNTQTVCAKCESTFLTPVGVGTERLEHELSKLLPNVKIARLDRDTCRKRGDLIKILRQVHNGEVDILLGTQMITKGHHFPNVTLVGVVLADTGLGLPDFRAGERTFQLISQVTGRAGRGEKPGRVIIQTFQPGHYSIEMAKKHNYRGMYAREIELRRQLDYPPFSRIINLKIEGSDEKHVKAAANSLARQAHRFENRSASQVLGPAPAPLVRLRGRYRWQLLIKGKKLEALHGLLDKLEEEIAGLSKGRKVKISIDVDPEYMM